MIGYEIGKHVNDEGTIVKVSLKVWKNEEVIRKHDINIGDEYIINQVNPRAKKNRGRKVIVTKFIRDEKYPLRAQVKYLDNNRAGRADIEDLDILS
jgi:hypothetical protein